jgi:ubiquinone/menaquinone biosynthesis C-methylase UbiE
MSHDLVPVTERFGAIADTVLGAKDLAVDPWLYRYCGSVGGPAGAERYVRYHTDLLALAGARVEHPVVIDAGCGFGFTMILHAVLGARAVRGIELHEGMVESVRAYLPLLPPDIGERIEVVNGNVAAMPYEDASTDIVLSIEAISHYLDVDAFIDEAFRVLRPGGVLLIADGNNGANPTVRRRTYEIWEAVECGPAGQTVHGHLLGAPYVEVRRQLLSEHFPALEEATRAEIARRTAGFTEEQVIAAAREHEATGSLPNSVYRRRQLAIAPDGTAMERLFSPHGLVTQLESRGFQAKAYGYWGGANGSTSIRAANRFLAALSPLTMPTAPSFRIVGRKS